VRWRGERCWRSSRHADRGLQPFLDFLTPALPARTSPYHFCPRCSGLSSSRGAHSRACEVTSPSSSRVTVLLRPLTSHSRVNSDRPCSPLCCLWPGAFALAHRATSRPPVEGVLVARPASRLPLLAGCACLSTRSSFSVSLHFACELHPQRAGSVPRCAVTKRCLLSE
jgi:hypothetical protein